MSKQIILGDRSELSLTPISFQWAFDYFTLMSNNFWLPSIVNMVKDATDYPSLTEDERNLICKVLGYLSTADVVAMRNISNGIAEHVTAVEVEMCVTTIAYQESVHTLSYQHILDSVSIPATQQNEIYSYYKHVPSIRNKIQYSVDIIDKMLKADFKDTKGEGFSDFIHGYWFFSQIFEGCLFVNGFNPILSLNRRGLMRGTAEQLDLIRQDEEIHKAFGARFIQEVCKEHNFTLDEDRIAKMMRETESLERAYIKEVMPNGVVGYTVENHMGNFKFLANRRMKHFKMKPVFNNVKKLAWHDTDNSLKREANFFERTATEYETGSNIMNTF